MSIFWAYRYIIDMNTMSLEGTSGPLPNNKYTNNYNSIFVDYSLYNEYFYLKQLLSLDNQTLYPCDSLYFMGFVVIK